MKALKFKLLLNSILNKFTFLSDEQDNLILYLCGNEALPNPLSDEEEVEYILKASCGDENAQNVLIEHNLRLVVYICKKFENTGIDLEDLISVGTIGLIKAVSSFKIDKNIKLATYASRCIENEILMQLRKSVKYKNEVSFEEPLSVDGDGNELVLADIIATDVDSVSKNIELETEKQILWNCIKKLNYREQEIMTLRFGLNNSEEKTQKEVADMLGISQSYISRIEKKILQKLNKEITKFI